MIPLKDNVPTDRLPLVTIGLIVANVIVYVLSIRSGGSLFGGPSDAVTLHYGAIPYAFTHPGQFCGLVIAPDQTGTLQQAVGCGAAHDFSGPPPAHLPTWETALTGMFMHGGLLHVAGNMLFLWIFGNNVEDSTGRVRYVVFYVVGGLAALALQILVDPSSTAPTIGASGAIAAVLGGYIVLYPRARVLTVIVIIFFFTLVELPALVVLAVWFALNALLPAIGQLGPGGAAGGGVAYFAHLGGFVFGLLLIRAFATRQKRLPPALG